MRTPYADAAIADRRRPPPSKKVKELTRAPRHTLQVQCVFRLTEDQLYRFYAPLEGLE